MTASSPLVVRRRPSIERQVIAALRGDGEALPKVADRRVRRLMSERMNFD